MKTCIALAFVFPVFLVTSLSMAGTSGVDDEVQILRERVEVLRDTARHLEELGMGEEAMRLRQRAEAMQEKLAAFDRRRRDRQDHEGEIENVMDGLERGIQALRALGREEEVRHLLKIAEEVRQRHRHDREDEGEAHQEQAGRELRVLRAAVEMLVHSERHDAADLLERAAHARRMDLEGRRDEESQHIRERAPERGAQVELLHFASKLFKEAEKPDLSEACQKLAEQIAGRGRRHEENDGEHRATRRQLRIMRLAVEALVKADRHDVAGIVEHGMHALELALEGRRDREALEIRERAPSRGNQVEALMLAAEILQDQGRQEGASAVGDLARQMMDRHRNRELRRPQEQEPDGRGGLERMEKRMRRLEEMLEKLHHELQALKNRF